MFEELKGILTDELQIDENDITPEASLSGDLGINSIQLADLIMICEEQFNIEIADDDIRGFVTVGDVAEYLDDLKSN